MKLPVLFITIFSVLFLTGCARYSSQYADGIEQSSPPVQEIRQQSPLHRLYLLGDAGYSDKKKGNPVLDDFQQRVENSKEINSSVIFLGDNNYPSGVPPLGHKNRSQAEFNLYYQINASKKINHEIIFIPGNHDWEKWDLEGLHRQDSILTNAEQKFNLEIGHRLLLPQNGNPGPTSIQLFDDHWLILIDSEWWMRHHGNSAKTNMDNQVEAFKNQLRSEVKRLKSKKIIIAAHHPVISYGKHGGELPLKTHLFPLTELHKLLYIPIPLFGTIFAWTKKKIGYHQDVAETSYRAYSKLLIELCDLNESILFVAGHDHNLQLLKLKNTYQIVSGSAAKKSAVKLGDDALFVHGGRGYSYLDYYWNGSTVYTAITIDEKNKTVKKALMSIIQ